MSQPLRLQLIHIHPPLQQVWDPQTITASSTPHPVMIKHSSSWTSPCVAGPKLKGSSNSRRAPITASITSVSFTDDRGLVDLYGDNDAGWDERLAGWRSEGDPPCPTPAHNILPRHVLDFLNIIVNTSTTPYSLHRISFLTFLHESPVHISIVYNFVHKSLITFCMCQFDLKRSLRFLVKFLQLKSHFTQMKLIRLQR